MERIPGSFNEYYASSISDLLNNEAMILRDAEDWQRGHWLRHVGFWFVHGITIAGFSLQRQRWQIPVTAFLEIPSVSHWPAKDRFEDGNILTIFDQTDGMELNIMGSPFERKGINPKAIKKSRWDNKHVELQLAYNLNPNFNGRYLTGIGSYLAPAFSTEAEQVGNNIPILNPQGVVN